jgi:serine/threonine protein kinase
MLTARTRLGPYEIVSALGAGGMGEVYKARDTRLQRDVAVKVLSTSVARDPDRLTRFEHEARTASSLNHPNILTIFEVGEAGGASELVIGETLRTWFSRGALPVDEAIRVAMQIAIGLATAHDAGIVHRDLKPEHVMIRPDRLVKLLDFGVSSRAS